jgi:carbon storage regulator
MLYLTRKIGEAIVINDVIEVTLVEIQGKSVKLGFQFPDTEKVLRRELYDRIKAEVESASNDVVAIQQVLFQEFTKPEDGLSSKIQDGANILQESLPKYGVK